MGPGLGQHIFEEPSQPQSPTTPCLEPYYATPVPKSHSLWLTRGTDDVAGPSGHSFFPQQPAGPGICCCSQYLNLSLKVQLALTGKWGNFWGRHGHGSRCPHSASYTCWICSCLRSLPPATSSLVLLPLLLPFTFLPPSGGQEQLAGKVYWHPCSSNFSHHTFFPSYYFFGTPLPPPPYFILGASESSTVAQGFKLIFSSEMIAESRMHNKSRYCSCY